MNNLHITLTPFLNESRVLRETASMLQAGIVDHVFVAALHEDGLVEREELDEQRSVWRVRLRSRRMSRSLPAQMLKFFEFSLRVIWFAWRRRIRLVNVHHLDLLPLGVFLKLTCGAQLVFDAHELETERFGLRGTRQALARRIERAFIRWADLVTVVSDSINEWYRQRYGIKCVATVLNCPEFRAAKRTTSLRDKLGIPSDKRIVLYQGGLSSGRGVEQLLDAFSQRDDGRHVLVVMGDGELAGEVRRLAAVHANIYHQDLVPPAEVLAHTSAADIGVSFIENSCLSYYYCLPNKVFEYIMAGVPVISSDLPEMRRVIEMYRVGVTISDLNVSSLNDCYAQLGRRSDLERCLTRASEVFSWENQERTMLDAYAQFLKLESRQPAVVRS